MTNYWILVAAKNHVLQGVTGEYAQAAHGKSNPLRRLKVGDGIIYYSPKLELGGTVSCQRFTALGCVVGEELYQVNLDDKFNPYRRHVKYLTSHETALTPLIPRLKFIKDKERWGNIFKFGIIHIPPEDFKLIATSMRVDVG
jgi:hypothetical protein